ncbi:MAG: hypothetical protein PF487_00105 [Bacteroidales bacterium]|jgi:hypothetical protein|nr:hypothetical protein [Bacteroidales bacterium]
MKRKTLFIIFSLILVFGCTKINKEPVKEYKYTIWVGSPAFGVGRKTDTFNINNGIMKYIDKHGNKKMHPIQSVYDIEEN